MQVTHVNPQASQAPVEAPAEETPAVPAAVAESTEGKAPEAPPVEVKPPEEKKDDKLAPKFAALSRRERELAAKEKALADKEKAYATYESAKAKAKENPLEYLKESGLSYEEITEFLLSDDKPKKSDDVKALEARIKAFEDEKKAEADKKQKDEEEKARADFRNEREKAIKDAGDKFELVNSLGRLDLVHEVTQEYYEEHKQVLTAEQAAQMVEDFLDSEIEKFKAVGKIRKKFQQAPAEESKDGNQELADTPNTPAESGNKPNTLINSHSHTATEIPDDGRPISDEESRARAAKLIRFL